MPVLHVIDPNLKGAVGHNLGHHSAFRHLARKYGHSLSIYGRKGFDPGLLPDDVRVHGVFEDAGGQFALNHYMSNIFNANAHCFDGLQNIDAGAFGAEDVVLLSSVTIMTALGYEKWLAEVAPRLQCRLAAWFILVEEIEDSLGRHARREGMAISDASFDEMDLHIRANEQKRSIYATLLKSLSAYKGNSVEIFYTDPFPSQNFINMASAYDLRASVYRVMYCGGEVETQPRGSGEAIRLGFLGAGGLSDVDKGWDLIPDIVERTMAAFRGLEIILHHRPSAGDSRVEEIAEANGCRIRRQAGFVDLATYCTMVEATDICVLPYGPRYDTIISGIFDDCLFLGKVCVLPANSKMGRWLAFHNVDFPAFRRKEIDGICEAVADAIDNLPHYRAQFRNAKRIARETWARSNPLRRPAGG